MIKDLGKFSGLRIPYYRSELQRGHDVIQAGDSSCFRTFAGFLEMGAEPQTKMFSSVLAEHARTLISGDAKSKPQSHDLILCNKAPTHTDDYIGTDGICLLYVVSAIEGYQMMVSGITKKIEAGHVYLFDQKRHHSFMYKNNWEYKKPAQLIVGSFIKVVIREVCDDNSEWACSVSHEHITDNLFIVKEAEIREP